MRHGTFLLLLVVAGCTDATNDEIGDMDSSTSPMQIEVTVEPRELVLGDEMEVRLVITNTSDEVQFKQFTSGCIYGYSLRDGEGEIVSPPPPICTMEAPVVRYQPGQVVTRVFHWVWDGQEVDPGAYQLAAGFGPRGIEESTPPIEVLLR